MRSLLLILALLTVPLSAHAETITGTKALTVTDIVIEYEGPSFFGTLPEGAIVEIATETSLEEVYGPGSISVPLPVYEDGTTAALEDVVFVIEYRFLFYCPDYYSFRCEWTGGPAINVIQAPPCVDFELEIKSWAFRNGAVGVKGMDFSQLKSLFK